MEEGLEFRLEGNTGRERRAQMQAAKSSKEIPAQERRRAPGRQCDTGELGVLSSLLLPAKPVFILL